MTAAPKGDTRAPHPAAREVIDELLSQPPNLHGWSPDVYVSWGLLRPTLELLFERVEDGHATLETGCGLSTVVFALKRAKHTVVSPWAHEHDRIRAWCEQRGISLDRTTFICAPSQEVLPTLPAGPLDLVLIDGDHAFPAPFIDWYYAGGRLVPGGLLVVDDTDLKTGEILVEFLRREADRWSLHTALPSTAVFERLSGPLIPDVGWEGQPFCDRPRRVQEGPASALGRWRARVRLRTRLAGARARLGGRGAP